MTDKKTNIELTRDEAIVLFEFLSRFNDKEYTDLFEDQSEQRVLWDLQATLEKELVEPFQANYADTVKQARINIRDKK